MDNNNAQEWVNIKTAAALVGYHIKYVRKLAHDKRIVGQKPGGRDWLLNRESLMSYKRKMQALGTGKHNPTAPWREEQEA